MGSKNVIAVSNNEIVDNNRQFLKEHHIWHILSENKEAFSCGDAVKKRHRLGCEGISIFDELKSELGSYIDSNHQLRSVLIHCRGNQKLDRLKISGILNAEYQRADSIGVKGLINPFSPQYRDILQIFDIATTERFCPPYTMMTNLGDHYNAVEFDVNDLVSKLSNVLVKDVVRDDIKRNYIRHKIGILTGNGPESGILLWRLVNERVKVKLGGNFKGDLSYPEIVIMSVPDMGMSMDLDTRLKNSRNVVIKAVIDLCKSGISLLSIACNTTQYFYKEIKDICNLYGVEFISMPDVIEDCLLDNNVTEFDFFGISHVADFEHLSAFSNIAQSRVVHTLDKSRITKIDEIAFAAKQDINKGATSLKNLMKQDTKSDTIVIALTELSTILSVHKKIKKEIENSGKTIVDTLDLLADRLSALYCDGIYETLFVDKNKSTMTFELLSNQDKERSRSQIWNILCEINSEFIPPLSFRESTTDKFNSEEVTEHHIGEPIEYFEGMLNQEIIVSRKQETGQITGFMSFIPHHTVENGDDSFKCCYITTIGVTKGERGHGITVQFYKRIEELCKTKYLDDTIATRTWSTNTTHISILEKLDFNLVIQQLNNRGRGILR